MGIFVTEDKIDIWSTHLLMISTTLLNMHMGLASTRMIQVMEKLVLRPSYSWRKWVYHVQRVHDRRDCAQRRRTHCEIWKAYQTSKFPIINEKTIDFKICSPIKLPEDSEDGLSQGSPIHTVPSPRDAKLCQAQETICWLPTRNVLGTPEIWPSHPVSTGTPGNANLNMNYIPLRNHCCTTHRLDD